jgi:hypothetical protein
LWFLKGCGVFIGFSGKDIFVILACVLVKAESFSSYFLELARQRIS